LVILCDRLGLNNILACQFISQFLGGPPAYLAWQIGRFEWLARIFFFTYWTLIGAGLGLLMKNFSSRRITIAICFLILLAVMHRTTQLYMTSEIELAALGLKK